MGLGYWRGKERTPAGHPFTVGSLSFTYTWWPWSVPPLVNTLMFFLCREGLDAAYSKFCFSGVLLYFLLLSLSFCWLHHLSFSSQNVLTYSAHWYSVSLKHRAQSVTHSWPSTPARSANHRLKMLEKENCVCSDMHWSLSLLFLK